MDFLLLLYLLFIAPKLLWDRLTKGKRHPGFLQRLGLRIPHADKPVIWIHAVSVGEVKAVQPLFRQLRLKEENSFFLITTTTATGQAEAKRSLSDADAFAYLPLDFSWSAHRWVKRLNPKLFLLVESDFWPQLLKALKQNGTRICLVNGKLSARSARRFALFPSFARRLFAPFDLLCLQNEEHYRRFSPLVPNPSLLKITGNLKLDLEPQPSTRALSLTHPILTLSCTHAPEEEWLLNALLDSPYSLILAPRHPERFAEVAHLLQQRGIPYTRWTQPTASPQRVLLIDSMGQLPTCYAQSDLAIIGGSFVDHVGGHNVIEPCLYNCPVLFGPFMQGQKELAGRAIQSGAGLQVPLSQLRQEVDRYFADPSLQAQRKKGAHTLVQTNRGATLRTLSELAREERSPAHAPQRH